MMVGFNAVLAFSGPSTVLSLVSALRKICFTSKLANQWPVIL
jgi:hypothetical protein